MTKQEAREIIARRAAKELKNGDVVNLGFGLPSAVSNYLPEDIHVLIQAELGMIGQGSSPAPGEEDPYVFDASGQPSSAITGAAFINSATSFAIIRGGHVDVTMLGALQCDEEGNIANWIIPGNRVPGMGGAMDLVVGAKRVIVTMEHTAGGEIKILKRCTLPLTAARCVNRIITEMGVIDVTPDGLVLREICHYFTVDEIRRKTEATLIVDPELKTY